MYLKSLTLKGFKSFASATTLRFEPGITAVVGPNGSGKSNVVDAIAWVLGEQGAKALRGGKMEDVIFAGTAGRPPLGRAEVTLTIDNSDNALPIEYTEVSITRRMFRDGASEYEINGQSSRLLDIQELLSDSGIGREMHVIVGQGQLDSVLQARPEDRRGFIEEAAGVLKHRKRKEKALRKLDAMQANLTRLTDLTGELRRQLKPLGRQAEVARRAQGVQAELRDSRLRLLADDLVTLRVQLAGEVADEQAIRDERARLDADLDVARGRETELDAALGAAGPALAAAQETWYRLTGLEERFRSTARIAAERARHLAADDEPDTPGRDPETLEAQAAEVRQQEAGLAVELDTARGLLAEVVASREALDRELAEAERHLVAATRAVADRREGLATLGGRVNALRTRAAAGAEEIARLSAAAVSARDRAGRSEAELDQVQGEVGSLDDGELDLDTRHETALGRHESLAARARELSEQRQLAERDQSTWTARRDALAMSLSGRDGAGAVLGADLPGVLGPLASLIAVQPGHEAAVAVALGPLADAVAVERADVAGSALDLLRRDDAGRVSLLVGGTSLPAEPPALDGGARWARDVVTTSDALSGALAWALDGVAIAPDAAAARSLVEAGTATRAVTATGEVFGRGHVTGGSAGAPSTIEVQAAVDEAEQRVSQAGERLATARRELDAVTVELGQAKAEVEAALGALNASDAQMSAVAEQLAQLGQSVRSAHAEADRLERARGEAEQARDRDLAGLTELEERLAAAESAPVEQTPDPARRDAARDAVAVARQRELDARLAVRSAEERVRSLAGRADALQHQANAEREARRRQAELRAARARAVVVAGHVFTAAETTLAQLARSRDRAGLERARAQEAQGERERELAAVRARVRDLTGRIEQLTDAVHRDEVLRAEQRLRIEQFCQRAVEEYGVEPEALVAEYGPDQLVPPSSIETAEYEQARDRGETVVAPQPGGFHRPTQEKRANRAERDLALLGKVNPLALEEFAALEERHQFLSTQLEDLKDTRRDLLTVVREVDERILEVFSSAYADVAREFEIVFTTLFPGGEGRLVLTDPDDMLATGIEVEARPPGKKIKRLSLLSGGERSLTAVALLVAIFRARPSPFYVMDEVEAALDEVNLRRLIGLIRELQDESQLIIITHQKSTMEVADALYGVSMRGDGITQVISQRIRDGREQALVDDTGVDDTGAQLEPVPV